ncbi:hypothetical protein [Streptococcus koreensis]|uniref:hypothetical protein n=1 Tax=Streptococcus koreensis TaxID=2382163 RepID=UPI0022E297DA|nr:hypothetical protein [Streptococcus koreensis]
MEIRKISSSIAIYSDGKRLQVIHNLGDEFILDLEIKNNKTINIDDLSPRIVSEITPIFKVSGYCSRRGEDTQRLKWAIRQFEEFDEYLIAHQSELVEWWNNLGGEYEF